VSPPGWSLAGGPPMNPSRPGWGAVAARVALECLLGTAVLVAADLLAPGYLAKNRLLTLAGGGGLVLALAAGWRSLGRPRAWLVELLGGIGLVAAASRWLPGGAGSVALDVALLVVLVLLATRQAIPDRGWAGVAEVLRVVLVTGAAAGVMAPMFTSRFLGGTDAHWYAHVLADFIAQWRTSGPPVFVGQGVFAWNGGIHPFRSAPVYMHVAGLWDWVTAGRLSIVALQHLTAITAAGASALVVYGSGVRLAPGRRWEVAAIAIVFVTSPGWLLPLYVSEAYMTYMGGAAIAVLLHGNVRLLTEGKGWVAVATGLSLAWMSHPPTAMLATVVTGGLQAGALVFGDGGRRAWWCAAGGLGLFGALSAGYFAGMSEVPSQAGSSLPRDLIRLAGLILCWGGLCRVILVRRSAGWWIPLILGAVVLGATNRPWLWWLGLASGALWIFAWAMRRWSGREPADHGPILALACLFLSALALDQLLRAGAALAPHYGRESGAWRTAWGLNFFRPLSPGAVGENAFQPGWGLWLGWMALAAVAWRPGARAQQVWWAAITLFSVNLLPWPGIGTFLVEYFPPGYRDASGLVMPLRAVPVFCGLLAFGLILALRGQGTEAGRGRRVLMGAVLGLAVLWSGYEAAIVVRRGFSVITTPELTERAWRTENVRLERFAYDLLPMPAYFNHGGFDPEIELRLRDGSGRVVHGPAQTISAMEAGGTRPVTLRAEPIGTDGRWMKLQPGFTLQPGERVILRFTFDPARHYNGYLMLISETTYREYRLPESGLTEAFGTGPNHARHLVMWNSGSRPENYWYQALREPGNDIDANGGVYAEVTVSPYVPARSAIRLESLYPWRARTDYPAEAWLETHRVFLPGYEVRVDGAPVAPAGIRTSANGLLEVRIPPGAHRVELFYRGSARWWVAWAVSLLAWGGAGVRLWRSRSGGAGPAGVGI
jgi:hypothetical protein